MTVRTSESITDHAVATQSTLTRAARSSGVALPAALLLAFAIAGCQQVHYTGGSSEGSGTRTAQAVSSAEAVDESVLASHGLETVWTSRTLDGEFQNVHVVGDDIFAVEERRHGLGGSARRAYILIAYDRTDGLPRWTWDLKAPVKHAPYVYRYPAALERDDELLLVQRDQVYCLDYKYGTTLWKTNLPFSISSGAVASDNHYFVGSFDGRFFSIPKRREFEEWFWFTDRGEVRTNPVTRGVFVYFTSTSGKVYRFHTQLGRQDRRSWEFTAGSEILGAPVVFGAYVFAGSSDYKLYCLRDIDGSKAWEFQAQAPILDTPLAVKYRPNLPMVLCISDDPRPRVDRRTLWAVNANEQLDGALLWRFDHIERVVAVGRRAVYALTDPRGGRGRTLVAIDGETGEEKFSLPVDNFDFIPTTVSAQEPTTRHRGILILMHKSGLIQAIGEKL